MLKELQIYSSMIKKDLAMVAISDLHGTARFPKNEYRAILAAIARIHPQVIAFLGDILNDSKIVCPYALDFFTSLASISDETFVIKGNHDELTRNLEGKEPWKEYQNTEFFTRLSNISNLHILSNSSYFLREYGVQISGLYLNGYRHFEQEKESFEDFSKQVTQSFGSSFPQDLYHILLCHSPKNSMELLGQVDLLLTGHMHNGCVPLWLEKFFATILKWLGDPYYATRGILAPDQTFFPKYARGMEKVGSHLGVIVPPLSFLRDDLFLLSKIANSFLGIPPTIYHIKIKKI